MKPRYSVVAIVPNGDYLLAIARAFTPSDVNFPGGHATAEDKSVDETLKRKIYEETGIHIVNYARADTWSGEYGQDVHLFYATKWNGKLRTGAAGKPLWARAYQLSAPTATFHDTNTAILKRLRRL